MVEVSITHRSACYEPLARGISLIVVERPLRLVMASVMLLAYR